MAYVRSQEVMKDFQYEQIVVFVFSQLHILCNDEKDLEDKFLLKKAD